MNDPILDLLDSMDSLLMKAYNRSEVKQDENTLEVIRSYILVVQSKIDLAKALLND
jgi:hypothetical protein